MNDIYGIDPEGEVTPIDVRNALVECFMLAHGELLAESLNVDLSTDEDNMIKRESIVTFLQGVFEKTDGDFDKPTKESMFKVIEYLKSFSKNFRDSKMIEKHAGEIVGLINKLS